MLVFLGFRKLRGIVNNGQNTNIVNQSGEQGVFGIEFTQLFGKHV